jgi:diguanylate cyclase (GGDEF)-like protein
MLLAAKTRSITRLAMIATGAIGLTISLAAGFAAVRTTDGIAQLAFVKKASESLQAIQTQVDNANEALFTLRDLLDAAEQPVTLSEFQFFADRLRGRFHGLRDTGWAPRVTRANRESFEVAVRASGVADFMIWERDKTGQRMAAIDRDVYFPILYPVPAAIAPKVLGVNIAFEPMRRSAVMHAIETRAPAATPPLQLVSGKGMIDGFMSFLPVFGKDDVTAEPRGVVYGVFEIAPLIENILSAALPADVGVYLYDSAKPSATQLIHWHPAGGSSDLAAPARQDLLAAPHWESTLRMADQTWGVMFVPDRVANVSRLSPALLPFGLGLLITAMIEAYLLVSMRRTLQLERLTEELHVTAATLAERGEKLAHLVRHDPLTGLRNRSGFAEDALQFLPQSSGHACVAVLMLDLDRFKAVNDTLGHAAGDLLLCQVAQTLRENVREGDIVARLGGDEFVIVQAEGSQLDAAEKLADRLVAALSRPYRIFDHDVEIGASIGVAICGGAELEIDHMLRRADRALYSAKIAGRGRWHLSVAEDAPLAPDHAAA